MNCDCIDRTNEALRDRNIRVSQGLILNQATGQLELTGASIVVESLPDAPKRRRLPHIFATFCPFCGQRYQEEA